MRAKWTSTWAFLAIALLSLAGSARAQVLSTDEMATDASDISFVGICLCGDGDGKGTCQCDGDSGCDADKECDGGCEACDECDCCGCSCYLFGPDEAWQLYPAGECRRTEIGGWAQIGYHTQGTNSQFDGDGLFNTYSNRVQVQQMWIYVDRAVDTGGCGWDWGYHVDFVYGTDGQDTQAFGSRVNDWDTQWDHGGAYGWAIPQAYVEVGYNNLKVKGGHFYTIIGYEVVQATGNFFYSRNVSQVFNEPFTHTGVLADYTYGDELTFYAGWTQGWDTGFSDNGGDSFLGGVSWAMNDSMTLTWAVVAGDFGFDFGVPGSGSDSNAYMNSLVFDWNVTDRLEYVFQWDFQDNDIGIGGTGQNLAFNNYFFYSLNDCWKAGTRTEWTDLAGRECWAVTAGVNYRPHANLVLRPEVRWDVFEDGIKPPFRDQTVFGMDVVLTF